MGETKYSSNERILRLLDYLIKYTDKENTVSYRALKNSGMDDILCDEKTFRNMIRTLEKVLNDGRDLNDRRIIYGTDTSKPCDGQKVTNIFYQHQLSDEDISLLEQGVFSLSSVSQVEVDMLLEKIEDISVGVFGARSGMKIQRIREPVLQNKAVINDNIRTIKLAIENELKIKFTFNGYGIDKQLEEVGSYVISPFYIAVYSGRFYIFGCVEGYQTYSIWRIDLMTNIRVLKDSPAVAKQNIKKLSKELALCGGVEGFLRRHIDMSYDEPQLITLKVKRVRDIADFTFLYDWFGDSFDIVENEPCEKGYVIVRVNCSPFGIINWSLQYADRVEILSPTNVREAVKDKVISLHEKYIQGK